MNQRLWYFGNGIGHETNKYPDSSKYARKDIINLDVAKLYNFCNPYKFLIYRILQLLIVFFCENFI